MMDEAIKAAGLTQTVTPATGITYTPKHPKHLRNLRCWYEDELGARNLRIYIEDDREWSDAVHEYFDRRQDLFEFCDVREEVRRG